MKTKITFLICFKFTFMKIIRDILWGAATQFGREFGRAELIKF